MFLKEIIENLGISGTNKSNYSILNYGGLGVYIQGNLSITQCSSVKISMALGNAHYEITGENLTIKKLTPDSLYIKGKIFDIINCRNK